MFISESFYSLRIVFTLFISFGYGLFEYISETIIPTYIEAETPVIGSAITPFGEFSHSVILVLASASHRWGMARALETVAYRRAKPNDIPRPNIPGGEPKHIP